MEVYCNNNELLKVYESGKPLKGCRLSQDFIDRILIRINALESAVTIQDLQKHPAFNFEKVNGFENRYSISCNKQYRLEFEIEWINEDKSIGKIELLDIINHHEQTN